VLGKLDRAWPRSANQPFTNVLLRRIIGETYLSRIDPKISDGTELPMNQPNRAVGRAASVISPNQVKT